MTEERESEYDVMDANLTMPEKSPVDIQETSKAILEKTNAFREKNELSPLQKDADLVAAAQKFADYMARTLRYGHTADGRRPSERASAIGYAYCSIRENIAYQYNSTGFEAPELADKFFTGWKESKGHRENMLSAFATEVGIGLARSDKTGAYFAVQMLGRPESQSLQFRVVNESSKLRQYTLAVDGRNGTERHFDIRPRVIRTHQRCRPVGLTIPRAGGEQTLEAEDGLVVRLTDSGTEGPGIQTEIDPALKAKNSSPGASR